MLDEALPAAGTRVFLRNAAGRYLVARTDRSCSTRGEPSDDALWTAATTRAGEAGRLFELHSSGAPVGVVLQAELMGGASEAAGCVLRLWIPSLVVDGKWTPLTESGGPDGGAGECTYDHTGGADFYVISADARATSGVAPSIASATTQPEEWLVFSAKGEPAPDGSNNASIPGIICADGTGEFYPDLKDACPSDGLSSWQLSGAQFSDGSIIATGYRDTTMAAAVSGAKNSEVWQFDPLRQQMLRQLLTLDTHHESEVGVDLILPGDERLVVGVSELPMGRQLVAMDLDGGNQSEMTEPGQGHHYGTHLSPAGPAPGSSRRLSCHVTGGVSAAVRAKSAKLPVNPYRIGYYSINSFDLSDAASGNVVSRSLVHGKDGHLFFDPNWSPDGRSLVYLDCHPTDDPGHVRADLVLASLNEDGTWGEPRWLTSEQRQWFGTSFGPADARGGGSNTSTWSPDGQYVTYTRMTRDAQPDAYFDASRPNHEENVFAPELARGGTQICLIHVESGEIRELTEAVEGRWDFRPQFSPSGSCLVFTRVAAVGACAELWVMEADGSNARLLTTGPPNGRGVDHPRWLPYGLGSTASATAGRTRL